MSINFSKTVSFLFRVVVLLALPITILLINNQTHYHGHAEGLHFISKQGTILTGNGQPIKFTGYNWHWSGYNCPPPSATDTDSVLNEIATASKGNVLRTAFYQAAYQPNTSNPWWIFDQYISYAKKYNMYIIPILVNNWKDCEPQGTEKYLQWYQSGYKAVDSGYTMSYRDWVKLIVQHYANEPTIAWWQLVNEPDGRNSDGSCSESSAASALRNFADDIVTNVIKSPSGANDIQHMVDLGSISWCGGQGADFQYVYAGAVDLCDAYHDYAGAANTFPSSLQSHINACTANNKPSFVGEAGICADVGSNGTCTGTVSSTNMQNRANFFDNKMNAAFTNGVAGYMIWSKSKSPSSGWDVGPGDPVETMMATYFSAATGGFTPTPALTPTPTVTTVPSPTPTLSPTVTPSPSPAPGTTIAQDTFQQANQPFWGTASDGHTWGGDANSLSVFSIAGNAGLISNTGTTSYSAVLGPTASNAEVYATGSLSSFSNSNFGDVLRWTDGNNWYKAYIDGSSLILQKKVSGVTSILAKVLFSATAGISYTIHFRVVGSTLTANVWAASASEPSGWMVTASDTTFTSGSCGMRFLTQSGTATVTSFQADVPAGSGSPTPTATPTATATATPPSTPTPTPTLTPGTVLGTDSFQRANQSLWGTASDGHTWGGDANSRSIFSISGNAGLVSNTGSTLYSAVLGPTASNAEVYATGSLSSFSNSSFGGVLRWTDGNNWYKAYIEGSNLILQKKVSGVTSILASVPFRATAGSSYTIHFRVVGSTLTANVWAASASEPSGWMVTASDSTFTSGYCGMRFLTQSGTATVTSFQAKSL